ncbi:phage tail tape measure protein [Veillonella intestinalis]|uniref:phage tail tape measure protein n=1 Tax=Veillonella intestinalis TaxID=2941341 RepID=UPI0024087B9A|nr:phage tail tape measure protein [Veillonella intestinalis]
MKLSASIELKDNLSVTAQKATKGLKQLEEAAQRVKLSGVESATSKASSSVQELAGKTDNLKSRLNGLKSGVYSVVIGAKDQASGVVKKVKTQLEGIKGKVYTATLNVRQNGSLTKIKESVTGLGTGMMMGTSMGMLGTAGIGFGIYDSVKTFADFEKELSTVKALTGATDTEMAKVKAKAMELGGSTVFTDTEVAQGMGELLKAGVSMKDVMGDASKAMLDLASAGDVGLGESAEIMSTTMNAFKENDPSKIANLMAGAANASATGVRELGQSFTMVSAVASGVGLSFEDTTTALAAFAQNGLKGSDAGTSLKTMLLNLSPTTKQATLTMERLGLLTEEGKSKFYTATGQLRSMKEIAGLLRTSLRGLTDEQRQNALETMFGTDAIRAGNILFREGAEGIENYNKAMKGVTAADVAKEKTDNLLGSVRLLGSAWDNMVITLMTKTEVGDGIKSFVDEITKLITNFTKASEESGVFTASVKTLGEALEDLIKKAAKLDGGGSILAIGALAGMGYGAYKGYKGIKGLFSPGKNSPSGLPGIPDVDTMTVNATTVIVNGQDSNLPTVPSKGPSNAPKNVPQQVGRWQRFMNFMGTNGKWLKRGGAALAVGSTAYDIATSDDKVGASIKGAGGLTGMVAGSKAGAMAGGAIGSFFGGVGAAPGAAIGGLVGGIGGYLGGETLAESIYSNWDKVTTYVSDKTKEMSDKALADYQASQEGMSQVTEESNATDQIMAEARAQAWNNTWESIKTGWNEASSWFDTNVWQPTASAADSAGTDIANGVNSALSTIKADWEGITTWFDTNVWGPLSAKASEMSSSITSTISDLGSRSAEFLGFSTDTAKRKNATGTTSFAGGWTEINERGGELIELPSKSRIYPHATTMKILEKEFGNLSGASSNITINTPSNNTNSSASTSVSISGNTFVVREEADIDKIAYKLVSLFEQSKANYGGAY